MQLVFVTHARTPWNRAQRIQGQTDIALDDEGRAEARTLGASVAHLNITRIVSSDLHRAAETATEIGAALGCTVELDMRLRECRFGSIEGKTRAEACALHGDAIGSHWDDQCRSYDFRPFGGECRDEVLRRHILTLETLRVTTDGGAVLIVGHGRGMNTLLAALGYPPTLVKGQFRVIEYG